jgi:hypothetical protein
MTNEEGGSSNIQPQRTQKKPICRYYKTKNGRIISSSIASPIKSSILPLFQLPRSVRLRLLTTSSQAAEQAKIADSCMWKSHKRICLICRIRPQQPWLRSLRPRNQTSLRPRLAIESFIDQSQRPNLTTQGLFKLAKSSGGSSPSKLITMAQPNSHLRCSLQIPTSRTRSMRLTAY